MLDEAISDGVATDAAGRNTLVKVKNAVLKIVKGGGDGKNRRRSTVRGGGSGEELQDEPDEVADDEGEQTRLGSDGDDKDLCEPEGEATKMLETMGIEEDDDELL